MTQSPRVNPNEAPVGYRAEPKPRSEQVGNICSVCDWRKTCNDPTTDLLAYGHRCMSAPVVAFKDGKTYQREDGASVIFVKIAVDNVNPVIPVHPSPDAPASDATTAGDPPGPPQS